ncbi:Regulatory protein AtoC [Paraburkholderia caffeinitolerans]|uniref:Regulatory protein AtoC n=1 Tax=Paraburkholderia caffeinitolerans TaxID=1723730 RepID=A0A6J5GQZ3_9BURK|nr:sigma-54 dependent transcriptional regulator [Paraburkholderia caffeinitolerans]CAB3803797.1 Regulatory protein AtoC [Paraburkholderia caffeinitolerans]
MATILIVDDDDAFREGLAETLSDLGHRVLQAASGEAALDALHDGRADCVFLDFRLPGLDGLAVLERLRGDAALKAVPVVMLTAHATSDNTIGAMRLGAFEHLTKPVGRNDIISLLERIFSASQPPAVTEHDEAPFAGEPVSDKPLLLGVSEAMRTVQKQLGRAATTDATVLITGETGTGKEVAAHVLHEASRRRDGPFVAVNCAAIPQDLLESELFGHGKGAFTGAATERAGRIVEADSGTLFLDEIGDMPPAMQAKLLRVLQERNVTPIGTNRVIPVDIRVVAATHRELDAMVAAGEFRQDLLYRLNVIPLHLPPLRERIADVLPLAEHFLANATKSAGRTLHFSVEAQRRLVGYPWPGNVRELKNAIERVCSLAPGPAITDEDLSFLKGPSLSPEWALPADFADLSLTEAVERVERAMIARALALANGNRADAARRLGISRQSLYTRMASLGLS